MKLSKKYRKFKRKHKSFRILVVALSIVVFWRGAWSILDTYLPANDLLNIASIAIAIVVFYLDDFHLKELE